MLFVCERKRKVADMRKLVAMSSVIAVSSVAVAGAVGAFEDRCSHPKHTTAIFLMQ